MPYDPYYIWVCNWYNIVGNCSPYTWPTDVSPPIGYDDPCAVYTAPVDCKALRVGDTYSFTFVDEHRDPKASTVSGGLPEGMEALGGDPPTFIYGSPTTAGFYTFSVGGVPCRWFVFEGAEVPMCLSGSSEYESGGVILSNSILGTGSLVGTGGFGTPISAEIVGGATPDGLVLGDLSYLTQGRAVGDDSVRGFYGWCVELVDGSGNRAWISSFNEGGGPLFRVTPYVPETLTGEALPDAMVGEWYGASVNTDWDAPPEYQFLSPQHTIDADGENRREDLHTSIISGALPPWVDWFEVAEGGFGFYGTPTVPGNYAWRLQVNDSSSNDARATVEADFSLRVLGAGGAVGWSSLTRGPVSIRATSGKGYSAIG